jgi:hypothetical protein
VLDSLLPLAISVVVAPYFIFLPLIVFDLHLKKAVLGSFFFFNKTSLGNGLIKVSLFGHTN